MENLNNIKLVVLGGGPGGYTAAFYAADLGMQVTLVDLGKNLGGVCLNRGCIPSKALLHVAKLINESKEAAHWGISFTEPKIDVERLRAWKGEVTGKMSGGLAQLTKQRKINYIQGRGSFMNSNTLKVEKNEGGTEEVKFDKAIIAIGSVINSFPSLELNSRNVLNSTSALELESIPASMLVVGGGYIGLELGSVYKALGTKVSVVEMTDGLLPGADRDLVMHLAKRLQAGFENIMLSSKVLEMKEVSGGISVKIESAKDGAITEQVYEKVLVSVGRKPVTAGIGLENTNVKVNQRGWIIANEQLKTDDSNIYAIGDIVGEPMLAHKASHEGRVAVEAIAGHKTVFEPKAIPAVVFTDPEIAWAGLTENQAKANGKKFTLAKFPWSASGRATTLDRFDGVTKLLVDPDTEQILGVGICGPGAGELIAEAVVAIEMGVNATDLKLSIHPHPTLSETLMEAAEVFYGECTHLYRAKR